MRTVSTVAIASWCALVLAPRPAEACSPPPDPESNEPPCSFVQLWTPAPTFPLQLEGSLRVGTFDRRSGYVIPQPAFDPSVQLLVHRVVPGGYEPVAFTLADQAGLVPNAKHVQLATPEPGQYVVSSPQVTCPADPSPTGTGLLVGSFELQPEVPLPTDLGELRWLGQTSADQTRSVGPDGTCGFTEVTTRVAHSTLELQLGDAAVPWADVLDAAVYVDGASYIGFAPLRASAGVATIDLTRICRSSDPTLVRAEAGVGDGVHTVKLVGRIEGLAMIESTETTFSLSCDDGGGGFGGCAAGRDGSAAMPLLSLLGLATTRRRRVRDGIEPQREVAL